MREMTSRRVVALAVVAGALLLAGAAMATWDIQPVALDTGVDDSAVHLVCADAQGGTYVAWVKGTSAWQVRVQHLDAWGRAQWTAGGIVLGEGVNPVPDWIALSGDDFGGMVVAWPVYTYGGGEVVLAQRCDSAGNHLWAAGGMPMTTGQWNITAPGVIEATGDGGVFFAWGDGNICTIQRLGTDGQRLWGDGAYSNIGQAGEVDIHMVKDGAGGVIVACREMTQWSAEAGVTAQRYNAAGQGLWSQYGLPSVFVDDSAVLSLDMVSDGNGGALLLWFGNTSTGLAGYTQRLAPDGQMLWGGGAGLVRVGGSSDPDEFDICPDGSGGMIIVTNGTSHVVARRLAADGSHVWAGTGVDLDAWAQFGSDFLCVPDGEHGALVTFRTSSGLRGQWIKADGIANWPVASLQLDTAGIASGAASIWPGNAVIAYRKTATMATPLATTHVPSLTAGGPYTIAEGDALNLAGTAANWDGGALTVDWDLNGDGVYGDATTAAAGVSWESLLALSPAIPTGAPREIRVRATNAAGLRSWAHAPLTIVPGPITACFSASSDTVGLGAGLLANAECSSTSDPYDPLVRYDWYWDDAAVPVHSGILAFIHAPAGATEGSNHVLRLRAFSSSGRWSQATRTVHVAAPISWCNLQGPAMASTRPNVASGPIFGRVRVEGVTSQPGATPHLVAWLGYGPVGTLPWVNGIPNMAWTWMPGAFNADVEASDEYVGTITPPNAGEYSYMWSYTYFGGAQRFGGLDGLSLAPTVAPGRLWVSATAGAPDILATAVRLLPNEPNPFNPSTTLRYELPTGGDVRLAIFDLAGRRVRSLVDECLPAGGHEARWDGLDDAGRAVSSGTYLARLETASQVRTMRMALVR